MAGISFSTFRTFVNDNIAASNDTLLKLDPNANDGMGIKAKDVGADKIRSSLFQSRTAEQQEINNQIRNAFMNAVLAECGVSNADKLPQNVKDVMNLSDYKGFFTFNSSLRADGNNSTLGRPLSLRRIRAVVQEVKDYQSSVAKTLSDVGKSLRYEACDLNEALSGSQRRADAAAAFSLLGLPSNDRRDRTWEGVRGHILISKLPAALERLAQRRPGTSVTRALLWDALGAGNPPGNLRRMSQAEFAAALSNRLCDIARRGFTLSPSEQQVGFEGAMYQTLMTGLKYESAMAVHDGRKTADISDFLAPPLLGQRMDLSVKSPAGWLDKAKVDLKNDLPRSAGSLYMFGDETLIDVSHPEAGKTDDQVIQDLLDNVDVKMQQRRGTNMSDMEKAALLTCLRQESANFLLAIKPEIGHEHEPFMQNRMVSFSFDDQNRIKVVITPRDPNKATRDYRIEATLHADGSCIVDAFRVEDRFDKRPEEILGNAGRVLDYIPGDLARGLSAQRKNDATALFSFVNLGLEESFENGEVAFDSVGRMLISLLPSALEKLETRKEGMPVTRTEVWAALKLGNPPANLELMTRDEFTRALFGGIVDRVKADLLTVPKHRLPKGKMWDDLSAVLQAGLRYESAIDVLKAEREIHLSDFVVPPTYGEALHIPSGPKSNPHTIDKRLSKLESSLPDDLRRLQTGQYEFGETILFNPITPVEGQRLLNSKSKGDAAEFIALMKAKINGIVKERRGSELSDAEMTSLLSCLSQRGENILGGIDGVAFGGLDNRKVSFSFDEQKRIKVVITPLNPKTELRDYRIEATLHTDGACIVDNFWLGPRTEENTLANAGRILAIEAFDLTTVFTGQKRHDAAAVLSLIDLRSGFGSDDNASAIILSGRLPDVVDKLANREPPGAPITRTMLWQAMGLGDLPPGLEDMPKGQFSRRLSDRILSRAMEDCEKYLPPEDPESAWIPIVSLCNALICGFKYESALEILSSHDRAVQLSDFVAPPAYGNAINNPKTPEDLLAICKSTLMNDLRRASGTKCTFAGVVLYDMNVEGKGRELKTAETTKDKNPALEFVNKMMDEINALALKKRGKELSTKEMAGLFGCIAQQSGQIFIALDQKGLANNINYREHTFTFDDKGQIKVEIKPNPPDKFARDYKIEATVREDGVCIIDNLIVSKRLRPVP